MSETIKGRTMNWPVIYRLMGICFVMFVVEMFLISITPSKMHLDISWGSGWISAAGFTRSGV